MHGFNCALPNLASTGDIPGTDNLLIPHQEYLVVEVDASADMVGNDGKYITYSETVPGTGNIYVAVLLAQLDQGCIGYFNDLSVACLRARTKLVAGKRLRARVNHREAWNGG